MKPDLLHILQHSLGVDKYGQGRSYRNRFVTGLGSDDFPKCQELVTLGYMQDFGPQSLAGGDHCFCVTGNGEVAMREASPKPPKLTRAQKRYQQFLKADSGLRFYEWLKAQRYETAK